MLIGIVCQTTDIIITSIQTSRQNIVSKSSETTSGLTRSKPLETKRNKEKPLQKVAPQYVKKVVAVAQVVDSIEDDELKKDKKSKSRPHSMTRMGPQTKSKATQVSFDMASCSVSVETEETGTQYEEILTCCELDKPEKVDPVEISRVLLSGKAGWLAKHFEITSNK